MPYIKVNPNPVYMKNAYTSLLRMSYFRLLFLIINNLSLFVNPNWKFYSIRFKAVSVQYWVNYLKRSQEYKCGFFLYKKKSASCDRLKEIRLNKVVNYYQLEIYMIHQHQNVPCEVKPRTIKV